MYDTLTGQLFVVSPVSVWSPDGGALAGWSCCAGNGSLDILEIPSGRSVRVHQGDVLAAVWSPDGKRIAYVPEERHPKTLGLFVANRDGSGARQLSKEQISSEFKWLDDNRLVFAAGTAGSSRYFMVDVRQPGQLTELFENPTLSLLDPRIALGSPSPDGDWVAFLTRAGTEVWHRRTGEVFELAPARATVQWAPKGGMVLVHWRQDPDNATITEVVNVATRERHRLPSAGISAGWSADGERVVFQGFTCDKGAAIGPTEIFVSRFDGTGLRDVSSAPDEFEYEYATSGVDARVAYVSISTYGQPRWHLHIRDLDDASGVAIDFAEDPHLHGDAWSPDGRYVVLRLGGSHGICT